MNFKSINEHCKQFDNYYIYDDGSVYSLTNNKFLKPYKGKYYYRLGLKIEGKWTTCYIHRLIALAFIPNPNNLSEVNHKDMNQLNNSIPNLEWVTHKRNVQHARENKQWKPRTKTKYKSHSPNSHPTSIKCQVGDKEFNSLHDALRFLGYGLSGTTVKNLIKRKIIIVK